MDKIKTCEYCSNSRTHEMTEKDDLFLTLWDLNFCYDDENDLSAERIFLSKDKQFDIMVVSGAGEPQRLEFRHWNKDAQRWFVYNIVHLKRCINCGRKIEEYPEFNTPSWEPTEANFYKAYDECVRLFKGEE